VVLAAAAAAIASYVVKPSKARAFDLFYGTVLLNDNVAPVSVDLATGRPTVKLINAATQVDATPSANLTIVPLAQGALLLNTATGEFNIVDPTGFVVKSSGGGVTLPPFPNSRAMGVSSGDSAYIVQTDGSATHVWLVNQSTLATAMNPGGRSAPRASVILDGSTPDSAGSAVSANGNLWLLSGTAQHGLRELSLPAGSNANARLQVTPHGTTADVAALASATANGNGTGSSYVALATPTALRIFAPNGSDRTLPLNAPDGTYQILPASNGDGSFAFLFHSPGGWSLVTATPTGGASVHAITDLPASTSLAVPAQSSGAVFTMSTAAPGNLWRIDRNGRATPVEGMPTYPIVAGEPVKLSDTELIARGSRVIVNSRLNYEAATIFADGSHAPVVIDKRTAVDLNASGGIQALAAQHATSPDEHTTPTEKPKPAEPVNDKIDCKTISQLPHQPVVQLTQRASRSVQLIWEYPRLSPQDCIPSTYTVDVTQIGSGGPKPPDRVTVQGTNGLTLTGLFPNTKYEIVVTAFINSVGTPSDPLRVATSPEGPPAPTDVHTTVDDHGDWTVTWNSCGGLRADCVPTVSWQIVPAFCDGLGLASPPANGTLVGDPTAHTFSYTLTGGAALLGRGLSFQVQGVGQTGLVGAATGDKACTASWGHPVADELSLVTGLQSANVASGGTTAATATLKFAGDQDADSGGVGATYTFRLLGSDGSVIDTVGPGSATSAKFSGIQPGVSYRASVTVSPPGHPEAAVTIGPVPVDHVTSAWPALTASAGYTPGNGNSGTLSVTLDGVSSAGAHGETFTLSNGAGTDSAISCPHGLGGKSPELSQTGFDPADGALSFSYNRTDYYGNCTVDLWLVEAGSGPFTYGGTTSPKVEATVTIPAPVLTTSQTPTFLANWNSDGNVNITCDSGCPNLITSALTPTSSWHMELDDATTGASYGSLDGNAPPATIPVTGDIYTANANGAKWRVKITYTFAGSQQTPDPVTVGSAVPVPTVRTADFTANWANGTLDPTADIELDYTGSYTTAQLNQPNWHWTETVIATAADGTTTACTPTDSWVPGKDASADHIALSSACVAPGGADTYTVVLSRGSGSNQQDMTVTITGTVPTAPPPPDSSDSDSPSGS